MSDTFGTPNAFVIVNDIGDPAGPVIFYADGVVLADALTGLAAQTHLIFCKLALDFSFCSIQISCAGEMPVFDDDF